MSALSFTVETRDTLVLLALRKGAVRQQWAISNAIATTLTAIQGSIPAHLKRQGFIVRKTVFMTGGGVRRSGVANKITTFPKPVPGRLWGRIAVEASTVSGQRRLLLPQFEHGGIRKPMTPGARNVAVPILGRPARPNLAQGVPAQYSFAGLRLRAFRGGKAITRRMRGGHKRDVSTFGEYGRLTLPDPDHAVQWKGQMRTFLLPQLANGRPGGVFQRIGRGRGAIRALYTFVKSPRLEATLQYTANAQRVTDRVFRPALLAEVRKTLDYHSAGGN